MRGASSALAGQLSESDKRIHFLETRLAEFQTDGEREVAQDIVETSAGAEPAFTPVLEGAGYLFGSSGCEAPRCYRAWNY